MSNHSSETSPSKPATIPTFLISPPDSDEHDTTSLAIIDANRIPTVAQKTDETPCPTCRPGRLTTEDRVKALEGCIESLQNMRNKMTELQTAFINDTKARDKFEEMVYDIRDKVAKIETTHEVLEKIALSERMEGYRVLAEVDFSDNEPTACTSQKPVTGLPSQAEDVPQSRRRGEVHLSVPTIKRPRPSGPRFQPVQQQGQNESVIQQGVQEETAPRYIEPEEVEILLAAAEPVNQPLPANFPVPHSARTSHPKRNVQESSPVNSRSNMDWEFGFGMGLITFAVATSVYMVMYKKVITN
ncbi:hypothetical protein EDC01DRAFT_630640 [Geopyxis carbonaria]|nr:hypothetical protein EDC01DRAFT_630640 [Geopyxis carbonaria]